MLLLNGAVERCCCQSALKLRLVVGMAQQIRWCDDGGGDGDGCDKQSQALLTQLTSSTVGER